MKLYLIYQETNYNYDVYDSAIVCAESEKEARKFHPDGRLNGRDIHGTWVSRKDVIVTEMGNAHKDVPKGVVLSSFNAG